MKNSHYQYEKDLTEAVNCMLNGGIILYPTDTVWGIGCDATNHEAIKKVYRLKQREEKKSMLVLTDSLASLSKIVEDVPEIALQLIEKSVNPLTIIYEKAHGVSSLILPSDGTLGIRITNEAFSKELCRRLQRPMVSTSANISGEKTPAIFNQISEEIKNGVDYIVNYRQNENRNSQPSNIIKITSRNIITVIR